MKSDKEKLEEIKQIIRACEILGTGIKIFDLRQIVYDLTPKQNRAYNSKLILSKTIQDKQKLQLTLTNGGKCLD